MLDAADYHRRKPELAPVVAAHLADLRRRFDVVICEGAGSPAEINLLDHDLVNLGLAARAGMAAIVVGDIERGGVFAALYGTVALLPDPLRACVGGFVINRFRGDPDLLGDGPADLARRCGIPTLGVLPWSPVPLLDAEDSLDLGGVGSAAGPDALDVALVRLPRISNFTDLEPLALEPGVSVRLVRRPHELGRPDLVVLPGTKATLADLEWLRATGLADAIAGLPSTTTVVGICGGHQMLGTVIVDPVEAGRSEPVAGLGLLDTGTRFAAEKVTRTRRGSGLGHAVHGYQIHHGRTEARRPWLRLDGDEAEGNRSPDGRILGTGLHGLWESDGFRGAFLAEVAGRAGRPFTPGTVRMAATRLARFDQLADLIETHLDTAAIDDLIARAERPSDPPEHP